jgi:hypothetical protein
MTSEKVRSKENKTRLSNAELIKLYQVVHWLQGMIAKTLGVAALHEEQSTSHDHYNHAVIASLLLRAYRDHAPFRPQVETVFAVHVIGVIKFRMLDGSGDG